MTVLLLESIFDLFFIVYAGEVWVPGWSLVYRETHRDYIPWRHPSPYQCTPLLPLFSSHSRKVTLLSRLLENLSWKIKISFRALQMADWLLEYFSWIFRIQRWIEMIFSLKKGVRCEMWDVRCNTGLLFCFLLPG